MSLRTRFAPSPTGALHLGHLRTHLVAWLLARSSGGRIVMRIEDLDTPRVRPGAADAILRDHAWLGLDYDEGPFFQSDRFADYDAAIAALGERVYACTCSRKEIEAIASAPHGDEGPIYPGTCRQGPTHPERPAAIRFRMLEPSRFEDGIAGPVELPSPGDFVVRRADGVFAYQLAVVVDDLAMGITDVVRGADLLASTPRQRALCAALGREPPAYAHVPLLYGSDGERLAKRNGARGIASYREAGTSPERLLGVVAWSLGLAEDEGPITLDALRAGFSLDAIRAAPPERSRLDLDARLG